MGLGSAAKGGVTLARARELAAAARSQVKEGRDPVDTRAAAGSDARKEPPPAKTFGEMADA